MRVGVDASSWINRRGYGRFTRELLRAMVAGAPDDRFVFFADPWTHERFDLQAANVEVRRVAMSRAPDDAAAADGNRSVPDMLRLTWAVWREPLDVFFSPSVYTFFPLPPRQRAVVTIHDAIAERFPELTLPSPRARWMWNAKVGLAVRQSRLILTVSDYASSELTEVLGISQSRIRVCGEAPAPEYKPTGSTEEIAAAAGAIGLEPGQRWICYVGGFNPHKHVDLVVRAHAALVAAGGSPPIQLLLVGGHGDRFHRDLEPIHTAIAECGTEALVHWTGFVPDAQLALLHRGSLALVLPSASEGYGLPAIEAAACGTPVIATVNSPLPQLLAGGGIFVEPGNLEALGRAMITLCADETRRREMGREALRRAAALSWEQAAIPAMQTLREAAR